MKIDKETNLILSISNSPGNFGNTFHNYFYRKFRQNYIYKSCVCSDIVVGVKAIRALSLFGMSISMPYKKKAIYLVDEQSVEVKKFKSLNTIINKDSRLFGFNTDVYALEQVLKKYKIDIERVLIIGSGAIAEMCNIYFLGKKIHMRARNTAQKEFLDEQYNNNKNDNNEYDLVINAIPNKLEELEQILSKLKSYRYVIDYPVRSEEEKKSRDGYIDGFELTMLQAKKQYELYTERKLTDVELDEVTAIFKKKI